MNSKLSFLIGIYIICVFVISCKSENQASVKNSIAKVEKEDHGIVTSKAPLEREFVIKENSGQVDAEKKVVKEKTEPKETNRAKKEKNQSVDLKKKKTAQKKKAQKKGKIVFFQDVHDFGFIEMGEVVDHTFKFVNKGNKEVNISNASASCGCTTPVFPFLPIKPGETGAISVRFNSKGRLGGQEATVTVYSDTDDSPQELIIKGVVRAEIVSPAEIIDTIK